MLIRGADADAQRTALSFYDFKKHKPDAPVKIVAQKENADYSAAIIRKNEPELLARPSTGAGRYQGRRYL